MLELSGEGWSTMVGPGEEVTLGRGGAGVDVILSEDPRLHRHCATVMVGPDWWELHNTGSWLRLRVASSDRFAVDCLQPGDAIRVPWVNANVQLHLAGRCVEFSAHFDAARGRPRGFEPAEIEGPTMNPVVVDRGAGYFRALVALCEPQLLDPASIEVATDLQIALRLNRGGRESGRLTGKTVERRLDNCRGRFGLKVVDEFGMSAGLERRDSRRRLVELALLTGTVTPEDLELLASPSLMGDLTSDLDLTGT